MHVPADTVANVFADHAVTERLRVTLHSGGNVTDVPAVSGSVNSGPERLLSHAQETERLLRCLTASDSDGRVADKAIHGSAKIDADDVTLLENPLVCWDSMHDLVVNRNANGCGIGWCSRHLVVQKGWRYAAALVFLSNEIVEVFRRHARANRVRKNLKRLADNLTGAAHRLNFIRGFDNNCHSALGFPFYDAGPQIFGYSLNRLLAVNLAKLILILVVTD